MNNQVPEENPVDRRIKLYKAVSSILPYGSFLVEYLIDRVPDQRAERLIRYIENINRRLEKLESLEFIKTQEYAALAENSIIESTKPISQKRLAWISSITVPPSPPSELEIEFRRKALYMLSDLSDNDVECLINHTDFSSKVRLEQSMPAHHFISYVDRKSLPDQDLFIRQLENSRLDVQRGALLEKGLIMKKVQDDTDDYVITDIGQLFVYVLTDEYPRD